MITIFFVSVGMLIAFIILTIIVVKSNRNLLRAYNQKPCKLSREADYFIEKCFNKES